MSSLAIDGARRPHHQSGYSGLLNLQQQPHHTVFLSDFPLAPAETVRLQRHLSTSNTRILFGRIDGDLMSVRRHWKSHGVDVRRDYVSLQGIVSRHENIFRLDELLAGLARGDVARLDLPFAEAGFQPFHATHLLGVVMAANYDEQARIADRFFALLHRRRPYRVTIRSGDEATLHVTDDSGWFDLAGRLRAGECRTLPGGEVSYPGDRIDGTFVVDGAMLASPEHPEAVDDALRLGRLSAELTTHPLQLDIKAGRVMRVRGEGRLSGVIAQLIERDARYGCVTEVGISFNGACREFVHRWGAASNEGRPGVHIAIGGDPDHRESEVLRGEPLVHLDLMTANCEVFVNEKAFLRASKTP